MWRLSCAASSRDILNGLGYTVEWHTYPMQHSLCFEEVRDISAWLRKVPASRPDR
jgi:phospholipase/carboxylesterase